MELKDYLRILRRHWLLFGFVLVLVIGVYSGFEWYQHTSNKQWESRAQILYMPQSYRELIAESPTVFRRPHTMNESTFFALIQGDRMLETVTGHLAGTRRLEDASPAFDEKYGESSFGAWPNAEVGDVRRALRVDPMEGTQIVTFLAIAPSPEIAAALANTMSEAVRAYAKSFFRAEVRDSIAYIDSELGKARREEEDAKARIDELKAKVGGGVSRLEEESQVLINTIAELENRILAIETEVHRSEEQQKLLRQLAQEEEGPIKLPEYLPPVDTPLQGELRSRLASLRLQIVLLATEMTADHPVLKNKGREIETVTAMLADADKESIIAASSQFKVQAEAQRFGLGRERNQKIAQLELDQRLLEKELEQAHGRLEEKRAKLDVVSTNREDYDFRRNLLAATGAKIRGLEDTRKDLQLKQQAAPEAVNVEMWAEPAHVTEKIRASASFSAMFFIALFGLVLATGTVYLVEYVDDRVRTAYDVRRYLNLPVPMSIPMSSEAEVLLTKLGPSSRMAEVFNSFAAMLIRALADPPMKSVMIASAHAGEGKSTVVANTAIALARMGKRVIAIDCDMRRPSLHRLFEVDGEIGLADYLSGRAGARADLEPIAKDPGPGEAAAGGLDLPELPSRAAKQATTAFILADDSEEPAPEPEPASGSEPSLEPVPAPERRPQPAGLDRILRRTSVPGLTVVPAGAQPASPISLLESPAMDAFLAEIRDRADVILIDTPPVLATADPLVIAPDADLVFLVLEQGATVKHEVTWAKRLLSDVGAPLAGVLLNMASTESHEYYYYGGYEAAGPARDED